MPYAFEIVQTAGKIYVDYEYMNAWRVFHFDRTTHPQGVASFDGDSIAQINCARRSGGLYGCLEIALAAAPSSEEFRIDGIRVQ
jgi:hypothetical protein